MSIQDGAILRVVAQFIWGDGEINQNVYNVIVTGAGAPWDEQDILDDCEDWLDEMYLNTRDLQAPDLTGGSTIVYEYDAIDDDWDEVGTNAFGFTGNGGANTGLPRGVAGLVTAKSSDPDTDARKYIPGLTEGGLVSELWDAAVITALLLYGADWVTPFVGAAGGGTFTPAVWSVVGTVAKALIGTLIVPTIPAYQRRRKNNVGV